VLAAGCQQPGTPGGLPDASRREPCPLHHDEDGDGYDDTCDDCPAIADPFQRDLGEQQALQFGDGIGDLCDPQPARSGDTLAAFYPFDTDTSREFSGDGWHIGADVARTVGPAAWTHRTREQGDGLYVQLHVVTLIWLSDGRVSASVDGEEGTPEFTCGLVHEGGKDRIELAEGSAIAAHEDLDHAVAPPFALTIWRGIDFQRRESVLCRIDEATTKHDVAVHDLDDSSTGVYAFGSRGAITDVASLIVYTFPISPCVGADGLRKCTKPPQN
jgi:hypothetical protein